MFDSFQQNTRSQLSDNRPSKARDLGILGSKVVKGFVGLSDRIDYYIFNVTGRSSFNLTLNKLQDNVDVSLLQGKRAIAQSTRKGKKSEAITTTLEPGTYYVRVDQKSGDSKYRLALTATPIDGPSINPNPSSPKLVSIYLPAGAPFPTFGLIDLSTGSVSDLPVGNTEDRLTLVDIASSGTETFAIDVLTNLYRVEPSTGTSTKIGDLGGFISGIGFTSLGFGPSGTLYTIGTNKTTRESGLYTVNVAAGGQVTLVANLPGIVDVGDLTYDATSGRFFAVGGSASPSNSLLYSISLTGDIQLIGDTGFSGIGALLFENGLLYGFDSVFAFQQQQILINTTTGAGVVDKLVTKNNQPFSDISGGA